MPEYQDKNSSFLNENMSHQYRVQMLLFLLFNITGTLVLVFSGFEKSGGLRTVIVNSGLLFFCMFLLYIKRKFERHNNLLSLAYFTSILVYILYLQFLTRDYGLVSIMTSLLGGILLVQINCSKRFLYLLTALYLGMFFYQFSTMPFVSLTLGTSYWVISFLLILLAFGISYLKIGVNKKYEELILGKINAMDDQHQMIKELNVQSNKVLEMFESVLEASHDGIVDIEVSSGKVLMSSRSCEILGFNCTDLKTLETGLSSHLEVGKDDDFFLNWEELKTKGDRTFSHECHYQLSVNRKFLKFSLLAYTSSEDGSRHLILVVKDVTNEAEQAEMIYKSANEDSLTGLMNRRALVEYIEKYREKYFVSCVAILDIDNFRFINDSFGYEIGDRLLKAIGESMSKDNNPFIKAAARLSSNDFALYLDTIVDEEKMYAQIQNNFSQYTLDDIEIKLNYSVGFAYFSDADANADGLIKKAEIAMYKAKERGKKGICVYSDDMNEEINRRLEITNELENAISQKEFYLNYQPKIDVRTGRVVGFESLIRWNSPRLGPVPPFEFIELAEQSGLIHMIGEFVLRESCQFVKRIMVDYGPLDDFRISVNVSAVQLLNSGFYQSFFRILDEAQVPYYMIGLEVTETAVMENKAYVCNQLEKFRAKGVHIYLDDFGTGYSSLNYLTMLPIDILKIDKSFVDHITVKHREYQVVKMILALASVFSFTTIAEGVETKEQLDILQEMDCHIIQGYYFSKPLLEVDAYKMVLERNPL
ncbi:bifunctional diguanylate cyclase/phosphodiesterase [Oceanispirochaeta crateris]|uniref:Bifunctional diguanylate cyclase/phosphodiesterase n=1 Tax=Oceanispirochaeta crateris TaxID=2518645 RepID=A0A5C1QR89_9SPIO|nr:bifunctional diguanylate cyclase/phosphodiesterase [Oceanispirochaeta crateris]QEN09144.1 bifunctional diguanylate cyclase/phosphodiesterase [Oceanispirochaeta crateris]